MMLTAILLLASAAIVSTSPTNCSCLASIPLSTYHTSIVNATYYPAKALNVSGSFNSIALCEVTLATSYGQNDTLSSVLWLPDAHGYENRFLAVGNGGMAGVIDKSTMLNEINSGLGFAVAGGDGGHLAAQNSGMPNGYFPYLHDEEQVKAWIHNGISLFTPAAKALTKSYYHKAPEHSYYYGCSTGGAQGFALAQFHPELFHGIYAGSPGNWYSHLALSFLWNAQHTNTSSTNLTQAELSLVTNAVLDACDSNDGVKDRLIENPLACKFNIRSLACSRKESHGNCLPESKISTMESIYAGPKRSNNHKQVYPGFSLGSEAEWILQEGSLAKAFSIPILQNLVFDGLSYDSNTFNWASDVDVVDAEAGTLIDEISPNLSRFKGRGGKLLTAQGWADPYNAATWPIEHLHQIEQHFNGSVGDFYRLFMIPGGGHCGAAAQYPSVPATYHVLRALIDWVERKVAPESVYSDSPPDGSTRTRKLCPWPKTARYHGGDVDDWQSYTCE